MFVNFRIFRIKYWNNQDVCVVNGLSFFFIVMSSFIIPGLLKLRAYWTCTYVALNLECWTTAVISRLHWCILNCLNSLHLVAIKDKLLVLQNFHHVLYISVAFSAWRILDVCLRWLLLVILIGFKVLHCYLNLQSSLLLLLAIRYSHTAVYGNCWNPSFSCIVCIYVSQIDLVFS